MGQDPSTCVINAVIGALRENFLPSSADPPMGTGTDNVHLFGGDVFPIEAWDYFRGPENAGCDERFIWVRLVRRYRSREFPTPYLGADSCGVPVAIAVEVGVARCSVVLTTESCDWDCYATEAEIGLDDGWRIECALATASARIRDAYCSAAVALDSVQPFGPEGGVVAWTSVLYAQLD